MTSLFPPTNSAPPPPPQNLQHHPYHQHPLQHSHHLPLTNHNNQEDNYHPSFSHPLHPHQQYPTLDNKRTSSSLRKLNSHSNPHTLPRQTSLDIPRDNMVSSSSPSPTSNSHPTSATNTTKHRSKSVVSDLDVNFHTGNSDPEASKSPTTDPKDNGIPSPPDDDKQTFYENLPFHGMQPPPNKDTGIYVATVLVYVPQSKDSQLRISTESNA
ncbi:hypothetical protein OTU49_005409 [Cherax quadricarinatus]|uniref:Uncharacterized protein n=1 Tax=Cherax quadricarinatus TaxID=27406 RepID=A0AAW0X8C0_CHEQU